MVARTASPSDRRTVLITLTEQGREAVDGALAGLVEDERALLIGLSDRERDELATLLRRLLTPFEQD